EPGFPSPFFQVSTTVFRLYPLIHKQIVRASTLEVNKELSLVYIMKEHLNHLWRFDDHIAARAWWHQWYRMALESNIDALIKFARNLSIHMEGLLAHTRCRLNTGVLEGMNNKIKVIKRVTYGFRDDEYFFLRIRHAFPGIRR
ncbi:Transposase, partial [Alkalispirochaeta americana]